MQVIAGVAQEVGGDAVMLAEAARSTTSWRKLKGRRRHEKPKTRLLAAPYIDAPWLFRYLFCAISMNSSGLVAPPQPEHGRDSLNVDHEAIAFDLS